MVSSPRLPSLLGVHRPVEGQGPTRDREQTGIGTNQGQGPNRDMDQTGIGTNQGQGPNRDMDQSGIGTNQGQEPLGRNDDDSHHPLL
jgi:hypothetical protein